jgi:type VI secretion system protein ImpH
VAPENRQSNSPLKDRLLKEFYNFSFFEAVHLLERLFPRKKPVGQTLTPAEEVVRFSVKPGLMFPASDISNMRHEDEQKPVGMEVAFMGLIGPSGVLPYWYSELALERVRQKDFTLVSFFDLFHHRLISLFYLAWKKYRISVSYTPGAKDRVSSALLGLIGLGTPHLTGRLGLPEEPLIFCGGLLAQTIPSAIAIEGAVEYFSETKVGVEQFIDHIIPIDPEDQTRLGVANGGLGVDAVCGSCAWESQAKFRIHLGPMGFDRFLRFLPSGKMLQVLFSLVRYMVGIEYEFEIRVWLSRDEVPPCVLGLQGPSRLGWTTWLKSPGFAPGEDPSLTFEEPNA